jgi:hypothetical protein
VTISEAYKGKIIWRFSARHGFSHFYSAVILNPNANGEIVISSEEHGTELVFLESLCETREEAIKYAKYSVAGNIKTAQADLEHWKSVRECLEMEGVAV